MPEPFNASVHLVDRRVEAGDGDRLAITGPSGSLTYAGLRAWVDRVAAGLRALGVRPEERVVAVMVDGPHLLGTILAAMRIGAVAVPVSTMLTGGELAELVRDTRARVLVTTPELAPAVAAAAEGAPELTDVVVTGGAASDLPARVRPHDWDELLAAGEARYGAAVEPYQTWEDSPALWLYTSGTTGAPKGAMHRHVNLRHVAETYGTQVLGIRPEDRCFSVAKLFFAYGIGNSVFFPLSVGASAVLDPARPTPESVAATLEAHRPTLFFAVPTFYAALLAADMPVEAFSSVRLAVSAGEPLPADLYRRFLRRFGVEILDGIGSTEALHIFLSNRPGEVRPGSTGRPVPGYDLRILDEQGREAPAGEPGSLYVRGASTAIGYWCRTDTTRQVFQGEWLRTGDTYVVSPDGYYTCLGRTDDMIKAGGIWVSPAEVEARLLEHPDVAQAAVVGLPDADGLDKPVACVVRRPGSLVDADELVSFCREGLAGFKRPRQVLFLDSLPTTATGKIQRFAVRAIGLKLLRAEPLDAVAGSATGVPSPDGESADVAEPTPPAEPAGAAEGGPA